MKTKELIKSLLLALIATIMPLAANAYDFMVDGLCYNLNSNGTSVTVTYQGTGQYGYANLNGIINIPPTVDYNGVSYSVSSIGEFAFSNCTGLTSVDIPNSVADIGQSAFWGCTGLTSVNIPNSVAVIGLAAFSGCIGLTSVDIPNSVTTIGENVFAECICLTSVTLPDSLTTISPGLFMRCSSLTSVTIPDLVTSIGNSAFASCTGLTSLTISNLVTSIGNYAFSGCSGLASIVVESDNPNYDSRDNCNAIIETASNTLLAGCKNTIIPNSVTSIGTYAFSYCTGLTSVNIPSSVTSIGKMAFDDCTNLTAVGISDLAAWCNIDFLGDGSKSNPLSFAHNLYLNGSLITELSIPSTVSTLKGYTFSGGNFTSLVVPKSVTEINSTTFNNCTNLTTVTINSNSILSKDYYNNSNYPINALFGSQVQHYIIGGNVKSIGRAAFQQCTGLVSVTIGNSVNTIGEYAFIGCSALTSVNFGNSVTNIKQKSFRDCTSLMSVTIPSSVISIGSGVFMNCSSLASIVVESGNSNYDSRDNCNAIIVTKSNKLISGCKNTVIPNSVNVISELAFYGCTGLNSVVIPHTVQYIGNSAFNNCHFTSMTIPVTVMSSEESPLFQAFSSDRWDTLNIVGNGVWTDHYLWDVNEIKTLNIGSDITNLDVYIYSGGKFALDVINCYAETPPGIGQYTRTCFSNNYNAELHVPAGSAEAYSAAEFWKNFNNIIPDLTDKVTLDKTHASLVQGETLKLNVTEIPEGGEVLWSTNNPSVATVDDNGTVTAIGDGVCDVFATLASNPAIYTSCHININYVETFEAYNGYLKFQIISEENHEAALVGYNEAIGVEPNFWGYQFPPDEPVVIPSVLTHNGVEYTVTEIGDYALYLLGWFENKDRYTDFWPQIILPETIRRLGKYSLWTNPEYGFTRVNLPESLEEMDEHCLLQGAGGGQYMLQENVSHVGSNVFTGQMGTIIFKNHDFELNANMFDLEYLTVLCLWDENLSIAANTFNGTTTIDRLLLGVFPCDIASNAFGGNTEIGKIAVYSPEPYDLPNDAFSSAIYQNAKLLVPEFALGSYQNAPGWKNFAHIEALREGDVDYDGIITAGDVTAMYNYLLNGDLENIMSSDVNGDGHVTSSDITTIYNQLLGE